MVRAPPLLNPSLRLWQQLAHAVGECILQSGGATLSSQMTLGRTCYTRSRIDLRQHPTSMGNVGRSENAA